MIKDFLNRKRISNQAQAIVSKHYTNSEKRKLETVTEDKAARRIEAISRKIRADAKSFKHQEKLGIYGTAKLAKEIQTKLESEGLEHSVISYIINSIVRG